MLTWASGSPKLNSIEHQWMHLENSTEPHLKTAANILVLETTRDFRRVLWSFNWSEFALAAQGGPTQYQDAAGFTVVTT